MVLTLGFFVIALFLAAVIVAVIAFSKRND